MIYTLRTITARIVAFFRGSRLDTRLDEELRAHVYMATEANLRSGMPPGEARRAALLAFGGIEQAKEVYRERRGLPLLETLLQDLRFGIRVLRRTPGFSLLAISCLTLGIGANAAVFGWIEGVLFRPYPLVSHQDQLYALAGTDRGNLAEVALSWPDLLDLQKRSTLIDSFIVSKITGTTLSAGNRAERAVGSIVSANYFDALGVHPILGRGLIPGEDFGSNAHPVAVISYQLWQNRFHGDPAIVGKTQRLDGVVHTIIGVAPKDFYGTFVGWRMQFWVPASMEETFEAGGYKLEDRGARWIESYARLKPGVSLAQAQQELSAIAERLAAEYPDTNRGYGIKLWPLWQTPFNGARTLLPTLEIMFAVVLFVLLVACANVGNLLLVRSFARRHEMTVRLAIGAGRGRLLKQLITEGLLLAGLGAAGGILVAQWCRNALVLLFPARAGVTVYLPGRVDWRVVALSAGVCAAVTILLGLVPAMQARKINLAGALNAESAGVGVNRRKSRIQSSLVVVQVCLSFVLVVGASLLLLSLRKIRTSNPGFSTYGVLTTGIDVASAGYDLQRAKNFQDALVDRVTSLPGVESAAIARATPLGLGTFSETRIAIDGYAPPPDEIPTVEYNEVGPAYFATMGIPLVSGREFTRSDDETHALVAIVNETMVAKYWRGRDPVGQRLQVKGKWATVIAVAKDSKYYSIREDPKAFFYVPRRQNFSQLGSLNIRTPLSPALIALALAREVHALDPDLAPSEVITMQEQLARSTAPQEVALTLVGLLAGLALLLTAVGLYGVMSYAAMQSAREMGVRMALGAEPSSLLRLILSRGLLLTAGGVFLGAAIALGLTRLIGNFLYRVSPRDPLAFAAAFFIMVVTAAAACFLPAWRASRTDPIRALRGL